MSFFISTNVLFLKPQIISLKEESTEINLISKSIPKTTSLNAEFKQNSLFKNNFLKHEKPILKLSYEKNEECNTRTISHPPILKEKKYDEQEKNYFDFKKYILDKIRNENELTLKDKLSFTIFLIMNKSYLKKSI